MNKICHYIITPLIILLMSACIGMILLIVVYCFPVDPMKDNMQSSIIVYLAEGGEYEYAENYKSSIIDNNMDALTLSETAYASGNPVQDAVMVPRWSYASSEEELYSYLGVIQDDLSRERTLVNYPVYWHGYLVILKPFYLLFDFADMRIFNLAGTMCCIFLLIYLIYRAGLQTKALLPLLVMLIFWNPTTIGLSITLSFCYYISFITASLILYWYGEKDSGLSGLNPVGRNKAGKTELQPTEDSVIEYRLVLLFLITGIVTVYVDALTYPVMTLCVPLVFYLMCTDSHKWAHRIQNVFVYSVYWAVGYAGMWIEKWILGSIVSGENLLPEALSKLSERSGSGTVDGAEFSRMEALWNLIRTYFKWPYLLLTVFVLIILMMLVKKYGRKVHDLKFGQIVPYLITACIPIAWILITANHCYVHPRLTYRNIGGIVFAILAGLFSLSYSTDQKI